MLGKLMKYEFKATARVFLPTYAALLVMAIVSQLLSGNRMDPPHLISIVLTSMLIAAVFVITLILTIQRFYKNLMTNEGYLMLTLPVGTGKLIWSKLIVAAVWTIVCAVVVFLSVCIMAVHEPGFQEFIYAITHLGIESFDGWLLFIEVCLFVLISLLSGILLIYACMALSMLFNKHRIAIAFAIYIGMTTVLQILIAIASLSTRSTWGVIFGFSDYPDITTETGLIQFIQDHVVLSVHLGAWLVILATAAVGAGFFAITRYMLKNKLNLQ